MVGKPNAFWEIPDDRTMGSGELQTNPVRLTNGELKNFTEAGKSYEKRKMSVL
jgi:hypothetical protein